MKQRTWDIRQDTPLVSISVITYNHAPYIRQCLDGILMQETDFPFELLVHDDASTDGTADIVKEYAEKYPNVILAICQKENQWSKGIGITSTFQLPRVRGKYFAICEGDDYWTDPGKLQAQADILEKHPDIGLVHTDVNAINENTGKIIEYWNLKSGVNRKKSQRAVLRNMLLGKYVVRTCTVCLRTNLLIQARTTYPQLFADYMMGDTQTWAAISAKSKFYYIPKATGAYRILQDSACRSSELNRHVRFLENSLKLQLELIDTFQLDGSLKSKVTLNTSQSILSLAYKHGDIVLADKYWQMLRGNKITPSLLAKYYYYSIKKPKLKPLLRFYFFLRSVKIAMLCKLRKFL